MTNSPQNTVELLDKYGEKVSVVLHQLADKIGVGIDHFYPVFVKQQYVEGIFFFALTLLFIVFVIGLFNFQKKRSFFEGEKPNLRFFTTITGFVVSFGIVIALTSVGPEAFSKIFNPEYAAIKEITSLIK